MKKVLCALSAALIFCGCAEARRPWTEALALVSPDRAADAASAVSENVPDSADIAPIVSPDLPAVSPDMIKPASADVSAVPAPVPGRTSADAVPAASADLPAVPSAVPAPVSPVVSADAAISDDVIVYETLTGSFFTAEAPEGEWRIDESAPGSAAIIAQDRSVFLAVTLLSAKHATLREAAESLAGQYPQGSATLKRMDDPDGTGEAWEFRGLSYGKPMYAQVFELDRKHYGSIAIVGDPDADDVIDIFNSIRFK